MFTGREGVCLIAFMILAFTVASNALEQQPTVGLLEYNQELQQEGYVLFAPLFNTTTYLINKCGQEVHKWESKYRPGLSAYILPDGSLLRSGNVNNPVFMLGGGAGGIIEKIGWDGNLLWSYRISDSIMCQHHDIYPMPNGNVLAIVWESKSYEEVVAAGRNPTIADKNGWFEKIIEIAPTGLNSGTIVWQWSAWEHLVQNYDEGKKNYGAIEQEFGRININYTIDFNPKILEWLHCNSVDYNKDLDQILISAYGFGEVWVIDHSTTTEEASSKAGGKYGKGGELLYRWGNPAAYNLGAPHDRKLFGQHNAHWIPNKNSDDGKIMIFNNGVARPTMNYSSVDIIIPPIGENGNYIRENNETFGPAEQDWIYTDSVPGNFFASNFSSAQRLPNGNILLCLGPGGQFFEVTPNNKTVWRYVSPVTVSGIVKQGSNASGNSVFKADFYPASFEGFAGKELKSSKPIELDPYPSLCITSTVLESDNKNEGVRIFPNPVEDVLGICYTENQALPVGISLVNSLGTEVYSQMNSPEGSYISEVNISNLPSGMYVLKLFYASSLIAKQIIIAR